MSCISAPTITIGDIPGLSLLLGDLTIPLPSLSSKFCCEVNLIAPPITIPLGTIMKSLLSDPTSVAGNNLKTALALIQTIIDQVNTLLATLSFDCPLD